MPFGAGIIAPRAQLNILSIAGRIDVAVRVRPLNYMEQGEQRAVRVVDSNMVVVLDPSKLEGGQEEDYLRAHRSRERRYTFDHAFGQEASQRQVYEATTQKLLAGVMDGYNASCFAYGATGAGKTYTMLGNVDSPGCMVHTVGELFQRIREQDSKSFRVYLTYLEVYNENIRDLLNPQTGYLDLREDPEKGIAVAGITEYSASGVEETMELLHKGNQNRSVEPTKKNETSSRSHAVMQIMVEQRQKSSDIVETVRIGKFSLIDLAGSERASATDNRGARLVEGANINRSLLALANCINALATESDAQNKAGRNGRRRVRTNFVPYRDSKLTRLLKDSFGGNCRTVMIANVSPAANQYEETVNSLKYANRAKDIKTKVQQNVVDTEMHVVQYQSIIAALRQEVLDLKSQLAVGGGPVKLPAIPKPSPRNGSSRSLLHGANSPDEARSNSRNEGQEGDAWAKQAVVANGRQKGLGHSSQEAEKLADKAKTIFKERARFLKKLIAMEEATYSLKIDLAVRNLELRGLEESPGSKMEEVEAARLAERELLEQVKEKTDMTAMLMSKLRDNEEEGLEVQQAMQRRVTDETSLERLAMIVKNHILEIQNIELQMRDRAKEQLRERMIAEVGKNGAIQSFLPKIEIAKWPQAGQDRTLFTPSSKAPNSRSAYRNAAEITSSRVFQLGSRLGSLAVELDEEGQSGFADRPKSAPSSPAVGTKNNPRRSVEGRQMQAEPPSYPPRSGRRVAGNSQQAASVAASSDSHPIVGIVGNAGAGGPQLILNDRQMDRYRERLAMRQEMMRKAREQGAAKKEAVPNGRLTPEKRGGAGGASAAEAARRRHTPEKQPMSGRNTTKTPDKEGRVSVRQSSRTPDREVKRVPLSGRHAAKTPDRERYRERPPEGKPQSEKRSSSRRPSADGRLTDRSSSGVAGGGGMRTPDRGARNTPDRRIGSSERRGLAGRRTPDRSGGGEVMGIGSGDRGGRAAHYPSRIREDTLGEDRRKQLSHLGINLDKTEIRNVMKPLQAESQIDRFAELQERYNLGKQNAAQKRRARNKLMHIQVWQHARHPLDIFATCPPLSSNGIIHQTPESLTAYENHHAHAASLSHLAPHANLYFLLLTRTSTSPSRWGMQAASLGTSSRRHSRLPRTTQTHMRSRVILITAATGCRVAREAPRWSPLMPQKRTWRLPMGSVITRSSPRTTLTRRGAVDSTTT